jgi:hypothetical protein
VQVHVPVDDIDDPPSDLADRQRLFPLGLRGGTQ